MAPVGSRAVNVAMRAYTRGRVAVKKRLARGERPWQGVRILGYHRIADEPHDLCVSPAAFREQMLRVLDAGLQPIRLDGALELLARPISGRYVCVTFDDGYRDNLEHAAPVLDELDIPATIFLPSGIIDGSGTYHWFKRPPPALSWEEIAGLLEQGLIDVQAHSRTHVRLPQVDDERALGEIAGSKRDIESHVPYEVTSFCYPAGLYGERELRLVRESGYRAAVTTDPGVNVGGQPLERLRRTLVYWNDGRVEFAAKLAGLLDRPPILRAGYYRRLSRA
jgi:peptidoglycan/xylan/chitin deacetylase (PgdA/CDA1 family)